MKRKVLIISSSVIIAGGLSIAGYNFVNKEQVAEQEFTVTAAKGDIEVNISATGVVSPTTKENIVPTQSGTIKEYFLEDEKLVKEGDILVTFEGQDVSQDLANQEANLQKLRIDLDTLNKSLIKYNEKLSVYAKEPGIVKEIIFEENEEVQSGKTVVVLDIEGESKNVEANVSGEIGTLNVRVGDYVSKGSKLFSIKSNQELENEIKKLKLDIESVEKTIANLKEKGVAPETIYAPFDGEINIEDEIAVGSQININSVLGSITNYSAFKLVLTVDELDIPNVKEGQNVKISAEAYPEEIFEGEVTKIASQGEYTNGVSTFKVEVSIKDPKELKSGMTANAKIQVAKVEETLLIPIETLIEKNGKEYVELQTTEGVKEVEVSTGLINENYVEVLSGVKEGQKIVIPITSQEDSVLEMMGAQGGKK